MPGHSRRKDGVASACLCPGHPFTLPPPGEGNRIWNFPMPSARDFFRFCVTFQRVVPANAGTHTPCLLVLALGQIPSATSKARGYGSLRSQGRPAESLCEAATASTRGSIQAICDSPAFQARAKRTSTAPPVVPANAGTHNHRLSLVRSNQRQRKTARPRRMGPCVRRERRWSDIDEPSPIRLPRCNRAKTDTREATSGRNTMSHVLAIDQGTTSSRAIVFRSDISIAAIAQQEFPQHFPASGWVEHEPEDIWTSTVATCREALKKAGVGAKDIAAIGITNQRETTVVWDRVTGQAIYRAIVWQDRRTADICAKLKSEGHEPAVPAKPGLIVDPYFSGTKVAWILDSTPGARARAERGELMFGTVDCYLLWRLTGGKAHATDATNASRTLLFNIHTGQWDDDLLKILRVPRSMLPEVKDSSANFGDSMPELFGGAIAISGIAGDQQAATIGQACFSPGMIKSTYGTGCFALLNTGTTPVAS